MSEEAISEETTAQAETENTEQDVQQEESATSEKAETEEKSEGEADQSDDKPRKPGAEKRIAHLTWQNKESQREIQALKQQLSEITSKSQVETVAEDEPTLESVGFDEAKYRQALGDYYRAQIRSEVKSELDATKKTETAKQEQERIAKQTNDFIKKGIDLADDFMEAISSEDVAVTDSMRDALFAIDKGPEVMYHLAQNPAETQRIASLNPYAQAVEIGRLEARLSMPQPKKTSSAPAPIKPLSSGGESATKHPDKMSMAEYAKWRQSQGN